MRPLNIHKRTIGIAVGCLTFLLLAATPVYAAEQAGYHHDSATDTADYCLSVHDVSIDLAEIRECGGNEQALQSKIIETAAPTILIRDNTISSNLWTRLSLDELTFDFSQFQPEENAAGYPVTVTAPAIKLDHPSEITFLVYVTNNHPEIYVSIAFADTDLADMEMDIASDDILYLKNIPTPQKEGYTFKGWYLDENGAEPFLLPDNEAYAKQQITGDLTLYPQWEKNAVFATVSFAGGEFPDIRLDITNGAELTLAAVGTPVKDGYTFIGWYLDEALTTPFLLADQPAQAGQAVSGDITLYSSWQPIVVPPVEPPQPPKQPEPPVVAPPVEQPEQPEPPVVAPPVEQPQPEQPITSASIELPIVTEDPIPPEAALTEPAETPNVQAPIQSQKPVVKNEVPILPNDGLAPLEEAVKEGVPMYEFFILTIFIAITAGFGFSIAADMRVLNWYEKKKKDYLAKMERML